MEWKTFFDDPIHKALSELLSERVLTLQHTDMAANVISTWFKHGLLDQQAQDRRWHRFSLLEAFWVGVVNELRTVGLNIPAIKQVKEDLLKGHDEIQYNYGYLLYHLLVHIVYGKTYYIITTTNGEANILGRYGYMEWIKTAPVFTSHIVINMEAIYQALLGRAQSGTLSFSELYELSVEEIELLAFIKQNDFQTVKVTNKDGNIVRLEGIERIDREKRIIDILKEGQYQDIEVKQENGKVVCIHRTVKHKL